MAAAAQRAGHMLSFGFKSRHAEWVAFANQSFIPGGCHRTVCLGYEVEVANGVESPRGPHVDEVSRPGSPRVELLNDATINVSFEIAELLQL